MSTPLSQRVQSIQPSATLSLNAKVKSLIADGKDIINLTVGEPDFPTPANICEAAKRAIDEGFTRYTAVPGSPELKTAIIEKLKRDNQLDYQANQIVASTGGKQALFNLCQALLNDGDEVIIGAPYWVSYPDMVIYSGGKPVIIEAGKSQNFKVTPEQLENAITDKTKLFFLNSPSNPTGVAYTAEELNSLAEVLIKHPQVFIVSDDIYEHIYWGEGQFQNILNCSPKLSPELYDRTIIINGVSKAYAMTGWRMGFAAGPADLIQAMGKIQSQSTSNLCSITQKAAIEAFSGDQSEVKAMCKTFHARYNMVFERIKQMPLIDITPCDGAFYVFPDFSKVIEKLDGINNDLELSAYFIDQGVAMTPGSAFGMPGYLRISYAASEEALTKALDRIEKAI